MLKRILGLLLCVAMLLSMVTVGTSAAYQESIAVSGTSQTIDGVTYQIVSTASELLSKLAGGGNVMLANDIALTGSTQITVKAGTLFDGNGHKITYGGTLTAPLFVLGAGEKITIRNVQFGTSATPMKTSGAIGLFQETLGSDGSIQNSVDWLNDTFYITNTCASDNGGGLFSETKSIHQFSGCTMNINLTATAGSLHGGWIGSAQGYLYFDDCVTIGSVSGVMGVGGFVGQNTAGRAFFENCINHAAITASSSYCGGFSGNAGASMSQLYFVDCTNYGAVTSKGSGYGSIAGGFIGRISNTTCPDLGVNGFYGCKNYGAISSGGSAGGIVGRHHDYDYTVAQYLRFTDCLNAAQVKATNYAGGMAGAISPIVTETLMTRCANMGKVTGSGYSGNFAGLLSNAKLTDCYAAGYVTASSASKCGVIAGKISGVYTVETGPIAGNELTMVEPVVSNVRYMSNLKDTAAQGATKIDDSTQAKFLSDLKDTYALSFVPSDKASTAGTYFVVADPQIRGIQQSVKSVDGKTDIRFAAIVNSLNAFSKVGFRATIRMDGKSVKIDRTTESVYKSLNAVSVNGALEQITASSLSGQYLCALTLTGMPVSKDVTVEITPYAVGTDGTEYVGKSRVAICTDGVYHLETMLLNGVALEKYSIVYPASSSNNEKMLAERLASKIGEMLGHTVSCYSDSTAKKANEILIGKTNRHTPSVSGRWIYRPNEAETTVVLTASNTTAISEVVEYFLEKLVERRAEGLCSWNIAGLISVPLDEGVSIMTYNTGGGSSDTAATKAAEWELIQDILPDIFTMQEPWAGWLDDFLNNYAVKPSTSFKASSSNDNVMSTNVNNKAFTGSGYYGVYWGAPRWVKGNANTDGKASYSVILYAKDRFTVDTSKSGTFWLSNTPSTSGSVVSGSEFARCATYATLTDKNTNEKFVVVNVHLDFDTAVKTQQITILINQLKSKVGTSIPIIVTGDMNAQRGDACMDVYFNNGWKALNTVADISYHNNSTIDWLLTNQPSKVDVQRYEYRADCSDYDTVWAAGQWHMPSDHPAVFAEMTIHNGATRPAANTETPPAASHAFGDWQETPGTSDTHYRDCECGEREYGVCNWVETRVLVEATHTVEGQVLYTCDVCKRTEVRTTGKLPGHSFSDWTPDADSDHTHHRDCECGVHESGTCNMVEVEMIQQPTQFAQGQARYRCSVCGRTELRTLEKLPALSVDNPDAGADGFEIIGSDPRDDMGPVKWFD